MHWSRFADDRRGLYHVDLREILIEIGFALGRDFLLIGLLSVARVDLLHHVEAIRHFAKRGEAHAVEALVVSKIDEELSGARVGAGGGKG